MKKEIRCIICPEACRIIVTQKENGEFSYENDRCKKGREYAVEEITDPKRMLTTTVRVNIDGHKHLLPVKTQNAISKGSIQSCMKELSRIVVKKAVQKGDVIYRDICSTGINIVATTDTEYLI